MNLIVDKIDTETSLQCAHCGEKCSEGENAKKGNLFCCVGCQTVYEILHDNNLQQFYNLNTNAGISQKKSRPTETDYLDQEDVISKLISYRNGNEMIVVLSLPSIHCTSCLWLLENIARLNSGIKHSTVNFLEKRVHIEFDNRLISLRSLVELLTQIGYPPEISLNDWSKEKRQRDNSIFYKLGISGFAFGNIMLLSFPEYLGMSHLDGMLSHYLRYLNVLLIIPVVLYCAGDYFRSAWQSIWHSHLSIDAPITLGILALLLKSLFDIYTGAGAGYLDSLAGLIFFLLVGKWFQNLTYDRIKFDLDYKSYFPISARLVLGKKTKSVTLNSIAKNDLIRIKHSELIVADGTLVSPTANIDYSFVTGESEPISIKQNNKVYSGGIVVGNYIDVLTTKTVSTSYLTQLWSKSSFKDKQRDDNISSLNEFIAKRFTIAILTISTIAFVYHALYDIDKAFHVFATVLIIACPCAVALTIPFTFGNLIRLFSREGVFFKNAMVIESVSRLDTLVFDKTGTITQSSKNGLSYFGSTMTLEQKTLIASLANNSIHPISKMIGHQLGNLSLRVPHNFNETAGLGTSATIGNRDIQIGSAEFIGVKSAQEFHRKFQIYKEANVYLSIDCQIIGAYQTSTNFEIKLPDVLQSLQSQFNISLISGDNDKDKEILESIFSGWRHLLFNKTPFEKHAFIKQLQKNGSKVGMIGDGLNDAGALSKSNVGISITEESSNFVPACDVIINKDKFDQIPQILKICKSAIRIIYASYSIAIVYNLIGIGFAVQGLLSPVIAAILMPLSSITVVLFGLISSSLLFKYNFIQTKKIV